MIPDARAIVAGHAFIARRHGVQHPADVAHVEAAVVLARTLATAMAEEPAALFFALARDPLTLPFLHATGTAQVTRAQVARVGLGLMDAPGELARLHAEVRRGERMWPDVRDWFAARLAPVAPSP